MPSFNMQDYVPVAERVSQAQPALQSVTADQPMMLTDTMGYIRVTVLLLDGRSATGTASFRLDLQGKGAQATNPLEDSETSAIGRALAFLGFSSSKSIASREEVLEARRREGASYNGDNVVPVCPDHNQAMRPGKDGKSFFCPIKHDGKWYSIKAEPQRVPEPDADMSAEWDAVDQAAAARKTHIVKPDVVPDENLPL